jgi:hypothetical protein
MLDTVKLIFMFGEETGEYNQVLAVRVINNVLNGVSYCDKIISKTLPNGEIIIETRFSYPRFYSKTNAYLIKNKDECLRVHKNFVVKIVSEIPLIQGIEKNKKFELLDWIEKYVRIKLTRVDVPFTYIMEDKESFKSYQTVYRVLEEVFKIKNKKCIPKEIKGDGEIQTIILSNTANPSDYNSKLTIYNQAQKFKDYYKEKYPSILEMIYKENIDLEQRIRMEVSKRINRKEFTLEEFKNFDIFTEYVKPYAKYILDNIFDDGILEKVKELQIALLKEKLIVERKKNNFSYENFIFYNQDIIYDWEILRRAIMETSLNENSGYQGTSTAKKILIKLEQDREVIYFGVFKKIAAMKKMISKYCKGGK